MKSLHARLGVMCALATLALAPISKADDYDKKTVISTNAAIEVPGAILAPGTYVLKLVNSSSNRHIVQIMNERQNRTYALTFTAAARRLEPTSKTVLTFYESKGDRPRAIRTWFYPGELDGQEFLYKRDQARLIGINATAATEEVAFAPKIETATQVDEPAVEQAALVQVTEAEKPLEVAEVESNVEEPVLVAQNEEQRTEPTPEPVTAPQEIAAVSTERTELPKTGSNLPLVAFGGLSMMAIAFGMRRWDRSLNR